MEDVTRLYKKRGGVSVEEIEKVLQLAKSIKYGAVTLVIQDGVLIQIETSEKIRLK